jgi:hypothetical protein
MLAVVLGLPVCRGGDRAERQRPPGRGGPLRTGSLDQLDRHTFAGHRRSINAGEDCSKGNTMQGCAVVPFRPSSGPES